MAIAKPKPDPMPQPPPAMPKPRPAMSRRQPAKRIALLAAIVAVLAIAWFWRPLHAYTRLGASYGAHLGCSCRFIEHRSLSQCRKDFEPGMGLVTLSEDSKAHSVTARYPLLARETASFSPGQGCVLENWGD